MAESKLEQTADEFRNMVRQAAERGQLGPAASGPTVDADALAAAVEARLAPALANAVKTDSGEQTAALIRTAVGEAMAEHAAASAQIDPELVNRLEQAANTLQEKAGDGDVLLHLRNVLPGQIRQELLQQNQSLGKRLASMEQQLAAIRADNGWTRDIARALLTGLVVAIVLIATVIFEKQLQNWGRDAIYPLVGISIKEATPAAPRLANPTVPAERR